jgi:hypothetical protein
MLAADPMASTLMKRLAMPATRTNGPRLNRLKTAELLNRAAKDERAGLQLRRQAERAGRLLRKIEAQKAKKSDGNPQQS